MTPRIYYCWGNRGVGKSTFVRGLQPEFELVFMDTQIMVASCIYLSQQENLRELAGIPNDAVLGYINGEMFVKYHSQDVEHIKAVEKEMARYADIIVWDCNPLYTPESGSTIMLLGSHLSTLRER